MKWLLFIITFTFTSFALAAEQGAAKAIIVKGKVQATIDGKTVSVKRGMWLPEGTVIETAKKSFTKLLFIDKSSMNVGPESKMKIDSFPKKDAGIITLIKGQIRSKVTKNYMDIKKKDKSKLFIKTETAAMGVRGTDFIVSFNPVNKATSLITFEGSVAMAALPKNLKALSKGSMQGSLEKVVSSPTAVIVKKGQYSGANGQTDRATLPVKVSPVQIETLEKNDVPGVSNVENKKTTKAKPKKKFKNIVPPGVDPTSMANESTELNKTVGDVVGTKSMKKIEVEVKQEAANFKTAAPAEGVNNAATGEYAPKAGGLVDLKSASYIAPPEDASFDANSNTYNMPSDMGHVDPATGDYGNYDYTLKPDGTFEAKAPEPKEGRSLASADGKQNGSATGEAQDNPPPPPVIDSNVGQEGELGSALDANGQASNGAGNSIPNLPPVIPLPPLPPGPPPGVNGKTRATIVIQAPN
jgi:hypothetical protein